MLVHTLTTTIITQLLPFNVTFIDNVDRLGRFDTFLFE